MPDFNPSTVNSPFEIAGAVPDPTRCCFMQVPKDWRWIVPILTPAGAVPRAHRRHGVRCVRCVRAIARGNDWELILTSVNFLISFS